MHFDGLDFQRPIPLFPLPNCVLFPGVVQPLHIFEPRYKQMMAYTLGCQSALAVALLKPGWEKNYYSNPEVHELACVGRIVSHEKLDDGKYNLLLHGVTRAQIASERKAGDRGKGQFRLAQLQPVADAPALTQQQEAAQSLQRRVLHDLLKRTSLKHLTIATSLQSLFDSPVPTPRLLDVLAFTLIQDIPTRQRLLETLDPLPRAELLLRELLALTGRLDAQAQPQEGAVPNWPPPLNVN